MRSEEIRTFDTDELTDIYRISLKLQGPATISLKLENLVKHRHGHPSRDTGIRQTTPQKTYGQPYR